MKKILLILLLSLFISTPCFSAELLDVSKTVKEAKQDYWVYVRLEDRSGLTKEKDAGRSKRGDVVDIVKADGTNIPSELAKKEWMIYKTSLTESEKDELLEPWIEIEDGKEVIKGYRKNKIDLNTLGVDVKKGEILIKIDSTKTSVNLKTSEDLSRYEIKRYIYLAKRPFERIYKQVSNYLVKPAYAFAITTCGDDSTADREQICTINKTGGDYASIQLWEDAKDGDLVTAQQIRTAECYDDNGVITTGTSISGSTTSSAYYMKVTAPEGERHNVVSGGVTIDPTRGPSPGFNVDQQYTIIEWMHITGYGQSGNSRMGIYSIANSDYSIYRNNLIHDEVSGNNGYGIGTLGAAPGRYIYNNIIYNTGAYGINGSAGFGGQSFGYNNTVYGCTNGMSGRYNELVMKNNLVYNNGTDFPYTSTSDDYNFSKDDTAAGANSIHGDTDGKAPDFINTGLGTENFTLQSTSDAIDVGAILSGTFTNDIDNVTRSGTWDIGADEYSARTSLLLESDSGNLHPMSSDNQTFSFTLAKNLANRVLIVTAYAKTDSKVDIDGITWNGASLTQLATADHIWYLLNPDVGTYNLVVDPSAYIYDVYVGMSHYSGINNKRQPSKHLTRGQHHQLIMIQKYQDQ